MPESPFAIVARSQRAGANHAQVLIGLQRQVADRLGGRGCLLLELEPGTGRPVITSACDVRDAGVPIAANGEPALGAWLARSTSPTFADAGVAASSLPRVLGTPGAIVARIPLATPPAALAIGLDAGRAPDPAAVAEMLDAFAAGLEWLRLRRGHRLQNAVRDVVLEFSRSLSAMPDLAAGLDLLCRDAGRIVEARRTSVWIHERRAHELQLAGASDADGARTPRVSTADPRAPAARGLRLGQPEFAAAPDVDAAPGVQLLLVPLRGRRRALGTLVFEDLSGPVFEKATVADAAHDLGRQLANAIENVQLLTEVLRSRKELENTFNSLVDLVAVCDREGRLVHVNDAFAERVGVRAAALVDRLLAELIGAELAVLVSAQQAAGVSRRASSRELDDATLGGTFSVTVTSLINTDNQQIGTVVVARDVTERVRLEAERVTLRQQLVQAEKLAALGQFVAGVAHELNNPLQGVLGNLELLRETSHLTAAQKREVRLIYREAERAARIVRNLLHFAGSGRHQRSRYSLNALVGRALSLRGRSFRKAGIEVVRVFDRRIPRLSGMPHLLQQAVLNILINAEHAMAGTGGHLRVSTRLSEDGSLAGVEIHDTGPGFSEEVLRRLFEPFFTTKEVGQGTGLGLALTYGIVQDHGGTVQAANHPDGGAVFTVEIPTDKMVIK